MSQQNKVYFMNNGTFDLRGMLTMGLSAKQDGDAIGFFGTGFKYAIAIILRNLGSIKITTKTSGGDYYIYEFFTNKEEFRGKQVDFIYIKDHVTGESIPCNFTTHMGANWKPWMALRELYCNCIDEKGIISQEYQSGFDTVIEVDSSEIASEFNCIDNYILPEMTPIHSGHHADIYDKKLPYIYYRGVAVMSVSDPAFSYNIKTKLDLTEDRTVDNKYQVIHAIQIEIQRTKNERLIQTVMQEECFENTIGFDNSWNTEETFLRVAERLEKTEKGIPESARKILQKKRLKDRNFPEFELTTVQQKMVDKALSFLGKMDVRVNDFTVKFVSGLGAGVMGQALDGVIYISEIPFQMGTKQLAGTLMEEWVHLKTGCHDFDRKMQNWLFDKVISLGENINGEPI